MQITLQCKAYTKGGPAQSACRQSGSPQVRPLKLRTDLRGQYEFKELTTGCYRFDVSVPADVEPVPSATIQVKGPGECILHTVSAVKRP